MPTYLYASSALVFYLVLDHLIKTRLFAKSFKYRKTITSIIRVVLLLLVVMTIASEMGLDIDAFLASFGITGLALSLASKEVLSNLISGISIQIYRPFKVGDKITIKGHTGVVTKINFRDTVIKSDAGSVVIPNRILLTEPLLIAD